MTQKLSGCHVSLSLGLTCIPDSIVTTFVPNILKVFAINRIDQTTYPEKFDKSLNLSVNDILYELHHTYRCYNDITEEPPFDIGNSVNLSGFIEMLAATAQSANLVPIVEDKSNPASWIMRPSTAFAGSALIVKSNVTSTIVKLSFAGVEPTILGYMEYPYPYVMRTKPVLNCITEPDPIVPTVTLNLETLEIEWQPNETYTVEVEDGFVNHKYGMKYSNPAFSESFTTNQPPYLVSWEPKNAPETGHIQSARLKYVRRIKHGDQAIKLYKSPSTLVKTYLPGDPELHITSIYLPEENASANIIVSLNVRDYVEANQEYYINVDQGALYDYDFFANSAISDNSTITFTASMPNYIDWFPGPVTETRNNQTVKVVYPYTALPNSSATGTIRFYDGDDNLLRTFQPTDATVTYQATKPSLPEYPYSTTITFDVLGLLREDNTYYLVIDEGVFQDVDEFNSVSVLDINELRYSTDDMIFPGLKANLEMNSMLSDVGGRIRRNSVFVNAMATLSAIGNRFKVGFSNQTSSFTISPTLLKLRRFVSSFSSTVTVSMNSVNSRKRGFRGAFNSVFTLPIAKFIDYILINPTSSITDPTTLTYGSYDLNRGFPGQVKSTDSYIVSSATGEWIFEPSSSVVGYNNFGRGKVYVHNSSNNLLANSFNNPDPAPGYANNDIPGTENLNKIFVFGDNTAVFGDLVIISARYYSSSSWPGQLHRIFVYSISTGILQTSFTLPSQQSQIDQQDINEISCNGTHIVITTKIGYYIYQVSDYSLVQQNTTEVLCTGRLYGNYFIFNSLSGVNWKLTVYNMTTQAVLYTKGIAQVGPGWTVSGDKLFLSKWDGTTDSRYINVYNLSTGTLISTIDKHQNEYLRITGAYGGSMDLYTTIYFATSTTVFALVDVYPSTQGAIPSPGIGIFGYNITTGVLTHAIKLPTQYSTNIPVGTDHFSISGNQLVVAEPNFQETPSSPYGRLLRYTVPN